MDNAHPKPGEAVLQKPDTQKAHVIDLSPGDAAAASSESPCMEPQVNADTSSEGEDDVNSDHDDDTNGSLYDEVLSDDQEEFLYATAPNDLVCTAAEAQEFKNQLHEHGPNILIYDTISTGKVSARKLCTAFGILPPKSLDGESDDAYYPLLGRAIARELSRRRRLRDFQNIDDAAKLLQKCNNIMVITGAGISTSLGIPDFRSKNSGFYSRLQQMGYSDPEEVFTLSTFDDDPSMFYQLAGDILPDLHRYTPTHQFIRMLQDKDKLLTNYTQNIDNIESHAGIRSDKLIQCHGSWATATCRKCGYRVPGEEIFEDVRNQKVAECKLCDQRIKDQLLQLPRPGMKRKRSSNGSTKAKKWNSDFSDDDDDDGQYDIPQPGVMKPDITFFGEALPGHFFARLGNEDRDRVDLVIVMGTSMKVAPVSEIPQFIPAHVPQIYISRDPIYHIDFDINLLGDCDTVVAELCRRAGWELKHDMIPENLKVDVQPYHHKEHIFTVKRVSEEVKKEAKVELKVEVSVDVEEAHELPLRTNGVVKTEDSKSETN